jgi:hypothetical protein
MSDVHVLIDRENLLFLRKGERQVLGQLAEIECPHCATCNVDISADMFILLFSDFELKRLYQNTTGEALPSYLTSTIVQSVIAVARNLPEDDVAPLEVSAQYSRLKPDDDTRYRYRKGSALQPIAPELDHRLRVEAVPATVIAGFADVEYRKNPAAEPRAPAPAPTPRASTGSAARPASAPRGGARVTIFEVADRMWEAVSKPTGLSYVLQLRKDIMSVLETEHGIKRSTSSTALGDWQKLRINAVS